MSQCTRANGRTVIAHPMTGLPLAPTHLFSPRAAPTEGRFGAHHRMTDDGTTDAPRSIHLIGTSSTAAAVDTASGAPRSPRPDHPHLPLVADMPPLQRPLDLPLRRLS